MRDSQYKSCTAQNQFTAYLLAAIRNYKRTYLKKHADTMLMEQSLERYTEASELSGETDLFSGLPLAQQLENGRLLAALQHLGERERYIFLSKVLDEKSLSEIARTLGITYGAAAMSYHRTISRLRNAVGGEYHEYFYNALHAGKGRRCCSRGGNTEYVPAASLQGVHATGDLQ